MIQNAKQLIESAIGMPKEEDFKVAIQIVNGPDDVEDIALSFVEDEVGRFDWMNNWKKFKLRHNAVSKVRSYLQYLNYPDVKAVDVVKFIDALVDERPGRWK